MGKFNSKVEQIESQTASWNGLCSTFEGPLYFVSANVMLLMYSGNFLIQQGSNLVCGLMCWNFVQVVNDEVACRTHLI